jgi:hypothetical protein
LFRPDSGLFLRLRNLSNDCCEQKQTDQCNQQQIPARQTGDASGNPVESEFFSWSAGILPAGLVER